MISNCGHDEHGACYKGGKAGDQTGTEWYLRAWYNGKWIAVYRHPDPKVRALISQLGREAALNDLIGYDQNERGTFWTQLCKVGYYPSKIKTACEADCSSGVAAIVKAVGHLLGIDKLKAVSAAMYTGNQDAVLRAAGFEKLTASKYLTGEGSLVAGDILLSKGHTCIEVGSGAASAPVTTTTGKGEKVYGFATIKKGSKGKAVALFQAAYNARYGGDLSIDGDAGTNTDAAIYDVQKRNGFTGKDLDRICGPKTWALMFLS
ncbi:MAG: peptidoglycan-binding protein [Adlercreutzia sp.]|nr:peptidoglycan-binding protein [Adlercreutzia sp.]